MVSAYDGDQAKMVYLKPPPDGYVFSHEYAGTSVGADSPSRLWRRRWKSRSIRSSSSRCKTSG
jgi:hypothetical protein